MLDKNINFDVIPNNENERQHVLSSYKILDSQPEVPFNYIAAQAAAIFNAPIAIVSLVDKYRVWYKASVGLKGLKEVPRRDSVCSLVILHDSVTIIEDSLEEPCLLANPFVAGDFGMRFYAGAPIKTSDGFRLGAVCVIDKEPRTFSLTDQVKLQQLADLAMEEIKLRLSIQ